MMYAIQARKAPRAVIVYERRCDLSPDGELLIYFAAKFWRQPEAWTGISRPPYFTALALWMKDTTWGGGGLFFDDHNVGLHHQPDDFTLAPGFQLPPSLRVRPVAEWAGRGEDEPIWSTRLARDGWTLTSEARVVNTDFKARVWMQLEPPMTWEKPHPLAPERYTLQSSITGIKELQGANYRMEHFVGESHEIGRSDWADWAPNGDLLFTRGYSVYRLRYANGELAPLSEAREIANLADATFTERPAPPEARQWF